MLKRALRLMIFAAIASAIATAVKTAKSSSSSPSADAAVTSGAGSDPWPEVPRNPATT